MPNRSAMSACVNLRCSRRVVGVQPKIAAGESFEYSSSCPLSTPFGRMHGEYYCVDETGAQFIVDISQFLLTAPNTVH